MIHVELLPDKGILIITSQGAVSADDFRTVAAVADPYIADKGQLREPDRAPEVRARPSQQDRARRGRPTSGNSHTTRKSAQLAWLETGK